MAVNIIFSFIEGRDRVTELMIERETIEPSKISAAAAASPWLLVPRPHITPLENGGEPRTKSIVSSELISGLILR